jgi:hypothetical protein
MVLPLRLKLKGYVLIKDQNGNVVSKVDNTVNVPALINVISDLVLGTLQSQSSGNNFILINTNITVNTTVSVSGTTITWSGSTTFSSSITITSLALYPIFHQGSNAYQYQASSVSLSTPIQLNAGTYTFEWVWEFVTDQDQGFIPTLLTLSLQSNYSSTSISYYINGSGASGFFGATTSAVFFVVYTQYFSSSTIVTNYSVTITVTPSSGSAQSFTLSASISPTTVPAYNSFLDFITIFIV